MATTLTALALHRTATNCVASSNVHKRHFAPARRWHVSKLRAILRTLAGVDSAGSAVGPVEEEIAARCASTIRIVPVCHELSARMRQPTADDLGVLPVRCDVLNPWEVVVQVLRRCKRQAADSVQRRVSKTVQAARWTQAGLLLLNGPQVAERQTWGCLGSRELTSTSP